MKFKDGNAVSLGVGRGAKAFIGRAVLSEVERGLKSPEYSIRTVYDVEFPDSHLLNKINAGVVLDEAKVVACFNHRVGELDILLWPKNILFDDAEVDKLVKEYERRKKAANDPTLQYVQAVRWTALQIYYRCLDLVASVNGKTILPDQIDSEILKAVASLGEAITEISEPILQAIGDLVNGKGELFQALEETPEEIRPPDEAEAKETLGLALWTTKAAYWFNKIVKSGALCVGYSDVKPFSEKQMSGFFLAAFLGNIKWGGKYEDHEIIGAHIVGVLRNHGYDLPEGLEDLVLHHHHFWSERYTYKVEISALVNPAPSVEEDNRVSHIEFRPAESLGWEKTIKAEVEAYGKFFVGWSSVVGNNNPEPVVEVKILANDFVASILILSLTEKYRTDIKSGRLDNSILSDIVSWLNMCAGYSLVINRQRNLPMMAYVIAALANAFKRLLPGCLVELKDHSAGSSPSQKTMGLNGSLAVVTLPAVEDDKTSPHLVLAVKEEIWLPLADQKIICLGRNPDHSIYREDRRLVVGVIPPKTLRQAFDTRMLKQNN